MEPRTYVSILLKDNACKRTKERFNKFKSITHRIEFVKQKINETLSGDGFIHGEPMNYFGIDVFDSNQNLWARAWEGWIPDKEIILINRK